ncbi:DUF6221 family protein [Actinomadura sp. HBU206391]|uniref:DUF6221 family protein n=1 Tax=Actinomadura sp. HBU206391 TaxID=2731692 RepID=UPI00164F0D06|nr:DUF6221 family protein [Actinomadura sp. HBU206391]MBC6460280.1 hypothetical protein [Actinomadura sp. HBU206391]
MTEIERLVAWLHATIQADKALAEAATEGPWEAAIDDHGRDGIEAGVWAGNMNGRYIAEIITRGPAHIADAQHIARHDPARVLAEVAARQERITLYLAAKARQAAEQQDYAE